MRVKEIHEASYPGSTGRTRPVSVKHFVENMPELAIQRAQKGFKIWRGNDAHDPREIYLGDPRGHERRSANTYNYTTLIIDNSYAWDEFPPRSRSFVCATSKQIAMSYAPKPLLVLPISDCQIGIASAPDFWDSFPMLKRLGFEDLNDLNYKLKELSHKFGIGLNTSDFSALAEGLDSLSAELPRQHALNREGDILSTLQEVLDPQANGITMKAFSKIGKVPSREVWLSAPCYFIGEDFLKVLLDDRQRGRAA